MHLTGIAVFIYSIKRKKMYRRDREWFGVLISYAIKRIMLITGMQLSGVHCIDY